MSQFDLDIRYTFTFITQDSVTKKSAHIEIKDVDADKVVDAYEQAKEQAEMEFPDCPIPSLLGGFTIVSKVTECVLEEDELQDLVQEQG